MSFTLTTLKSTVQDYCETAETTFVADLDTFIEEAEERILKNVSLPVFRKNVTGNATTGFPYLATPSDFLASYSLALIIDSVYTYPLFKHTTFIRQYTPNANTTVLKNPEEAAQYEQRFSQAVASLKALGEGYGSRDEYRYDIARG
jgi:hypothetical protein